MVVCYRSYFAQEENINLGLVAHRFTEITGLDFSILKKGFTHMQAQHVEECSN